MTLARAEELFYAALVADDDLVAIVGTRIWPNVAAEGAPAPLVVYERRASAPVTTIHDGEPVASKVSISASCWAPTPLAAEQLGDQLQIAVRGVATCVNRFSHYDDQLASHAAVLDLEVWEV